MVTRRRSREHVYLGVLVHPLVDHRSDFGTRAHAAATDPGLKGPAGCGRGPSLWPPTKTQPRLMAGAVKVAICDGLELRVFHLVLFFVGAVPAKKVRQVLREG